MHASKSAHRQPQTSFIDEIRQNIDKGPQFIAKICFGRL